MEWSGEGYILSVQKHGETSAIIDTITRDHGRRQGLIRGGVSRRMRPVLQAGNYVSLTWRARLSDHLGYFNAEPITTHAAALMEDRLSLAGLNALCALSRVLLPEREAYPAVFDGFHIIVENLTDPDVWPALFLSWEMGVLKTLGYGLDLTRCAASGVRDNLTHVSPRSGRAVSAQAAEPYLDKLFPLPDFMRGSEFMGEKSHIPPRSIGQGFALTGYFLETRVQWSVNKSLPKARERMFNLLCEMGYATI